MMSPDCFDVQILRRMDLSPQVILLRFRVIGQAALDWRAGQYIQLTSPKSGQKQLAFSIASAMDPEHPGEFDLAVARRTSAADFEPGCVLKARGPRGSFTWEATAEDSVFLVGIGTGSAPLRALILEQMGAAQRNDMLFLFGCRTETDLLWQTEMTELSLRVPHFQFEPTLTQGSGEWTGRRGRVQRHLPELLAGVRRPRAYICGRRDMVEEVKTLFLNHGVSSDRIRAEGY